MLQRRFTNTVLFRAFSFDSALVVSSIALATALSLYNVHLVLHRSLELRGKSILTALSREAEFPLLMNNRVELQASVDRIALWEGVVGAEIVPAEGGAISAARPEGGKNDPKVVVFRQTVQAEGTPMLDWGDQTQVHRVLGEVRVTLSRRDENDFVRRSTLWSLEIAGAIVLLACILQYFRLRRVLRPLDHLVKTAGRIEAGEMVCAEHADSVFEYGRLVEAFNRMVTSLRGTLARLQESEERYGLAVDGSNDGIWDLDLEHGTLYLSPRWKSMLGYAPDELSPHLSAWLELVHADDRKELQARLDAHCAGLTPIFECEYRVYDKSRGIRWMRCRGKGFRPAGADRATRIAGSQTDITESKAFDPLTGLPNRVLFRERLDVAIEGCRSGAHKVAVLFLDVDDFKLINDSLGHLTGDQLLRQLADRLRRSLDGQCRAGLFAGWILARFGGDEFAVLAETSPDSPIDEVLDGAVIEATHQPFRIDGREFFVTLSAGMATTGDPNRSSEELLRDADTAMYCAKAAGGGKFRVFAERMRQSALERLSMESELRLALEREEFELYYQPKVNLANGRVTDFEALIRWNHPTRGVLRPAQFIAFAEESGLILGLGAWVIRQACVQVAEWRRKYPAHAVSVSVNVSPKQLVTEGLVEQVRAALEAVQLPPRLLNVEVTESTVMENPERAADILNQLHRMGLGIHIDDFGTGHSSLHCLRKYPFDTLKIDRSFVTNADRDYGSTEIIRAVVALATALGLEIVAEGLERADQVKRSKMLGCTYGQGYFFGKPLPARMFDEILRGNGNAAFPLVLDGEQSDLVALSAALERAPLREPLQRHRIQEEGSGAGTGARG